MKIHIYIKGLHASVGGVKLKIAKEEDTFLFFRCVLCYLESAIKITAKLDRVYGRKGEMEMVFINIYK